MAWHNVDLNNVKHIKKRQELKSAEWHPARRMDWCGPEDKLKKIKPFLIDEN